MIDRLRCFVCGKVIEREPEIYEVGIFEVYTSEYQFLEWACRECKDKIARVLERMRRTTSTG